MEKIVALFDTHVPFNIHLDPIFMFIEDFKPTTIILGGDMHDWTSVCQWIADQSRALDGGTVAQNYQELKDAVLHPIYNASPKSKKIYLTGNHEDWLTKAGMLNPNGRQYWELERNLSYYRNLTILPVNTPYTVGPNLVYIHGIYTNEYHAKKTVGAFHNSILYGHTHDRQEYTEVSPIDAKKLYKGASCGCLCHRNPNYLRNKPNRWVNGFSYAYVDTKTGNFNDYFVYVIEGKFWAEGRYYK